jgi:hypothetical protein
MMRKVVYPNLNDPVNLCDVFDADRITPDGDLYRVAEAVFRQEADLIWMGYERGEYEKRTV